MTFRLCLFPFAASFVAFVSLSAQTPQAPPSAGSAVDRAWSMLTSNVSADKPAHDRIQALAALGSMGNDPRAARLIGDAIVEHNMDVRTAAILAAGQTKNPELTTRLRAALDDDQPQVAYAAATTLWKMHDESGEDLLLAVAGGERKDHPGKIKAEKHKAAKEMHSPRALAKIGIDQGSGYVLGPFGFGVQAIEFIHKNGGDPGRAAAIDLLSEQHSEAVHNELIDDLADHDFAVRAAAAKGLGRWPSRDTANRLLPLFDDSKLAVRLTAAAAYIRVLAPPPLESESRSKANHPQPAQPTEPAAAEAAPQPAARAPSTVEPAPQPAAPAPSTGEPARPPAAAPAPPQQ